MTQLFKQKIFHFVGCLMVLMASGCATHIKMTDTHNPVPVCKLCNFDKYELMDITIAPEYADHKANIKATKKIQEVLNSRLENTMNAWNQSEAPASRGTLVIEPNIAQIKFIGGNARFWLGALAGSSAVSMNVVYKEKETGEIIANPKFYQSANAWGGAWSVGGADNAMLNRVANLIADYTIANYTSAIGGKTGKPEKQGQ